MMLISNNAFQEWLIAHLNNLSYYVNLDSFYFRIYQDKITVFHGIYYIDFSPYFLNPDSLSIFCGDCLHDPYNWQKTRQCTYNYKIVTGDPLNTYLRINTTTNVYFIQEVITNGITNGRKISFKYGVSICEGCNSLCQYSEDTNQADETDETDETDEITYDENQSDEGSNDENTQTVTQCEISAGNDLIFNGILCNDEFYYSSSQCIQCPNNCKSCTLNGCVTCKDGYYLNSENSCSSCSEGCDLCQYVDDQQICTQCSTTPYFQLQSLNFQTCEECEYLCNKCEFVSYNTDWIHYATRDQYSYSDLNYIKRCRICEEIDYLISPQGEQCERCQIENCQLCYYELEQGTTLDYDFIPSSPKGGEGQKCKQCKTGFTVKDFKCEPLSDTTSNCKSAIENDQKCLSCDTNIVLSLPDNQCLDQKCSSKIKYCITCYSDIKQFGDVIVGQESLTYYQCIQCDPGYYVDIFTGACISCPKNCKTCKQYTNSYDFSSYLQTLQPISDQDLENFISEPLQDLLCLECQDDFSLFGGTCMGCTGNCYYYDATDDSFYSGCYEDEEKAFCMRCQNSKQSQSLISDMSECQDCVQFCAACRDRTDADPIVNPYFSPSSDQLLMYGQICYKLRDDLAQEIANIQATQTDNFLTSVFLDSQLGLPVQCYNTTLSTTTSLNKCYNSYNISIQLACDSSIKNVKQLSTFTSQKTSVILIKFNEDSYNNYVTFNKMAIRELNIKLTLLGSTCTFNRETKFQFQFLQNVYSLSKVNLIIETSEQQLWEASGLINFEGVSSVSINNIVLQYIKAKGTAQFGFQLKSNDETQFSLSQVEFQKQEETSVLKIYLENPINITLQDVKFSTVLQGTDQVMSLNYSKSSLSYQDFKIINVIINDFILNSTNFLEFSSKASNAFLLIQNFKIINGEMYSNSLIKSNNPSCNLIATITGVQIHQSLFQNVTVFYLSNLQKSGQFEGLDSVQNIFNQSTLFLLNTFQLSKIYVSRNALYNESKLMMTVNEIKTNDLIKSSIQSYMLDRIKIVNSKCFSLNCLFVISTPVNYYSIVTTLDIKNMELDNIVISDITQRDVLLTTSALIKLTNLAAVNFNNIVLDNMIGITMFYIEQISKLSVIKFRYDWSQSNFIESQINPKNNLVAISSDCANRKLSAYAFTYILFFINQFSTSVLFNDILIQRQLLLDASFIHIQSYDVSYYNTTVGKTVETITFNNMSFFNNSIMSNTKGLFSGCIIIQSNQIQTISINSINFQSTHLQQLISKQIIRLSALFQIISPKGNITINNLQSDYNRAISCQEGLIIISCYSLILNQAIFRYTNIQDKNWLQILEPNQLSSDDDAISFFEILSHGTIMEVTLSQGNFTDIFVNYTYGVQPGFKLITIGSSQIFMSNIWMTNIFGNLELKFSSVGGGLFVDSGFSSLNLSIFNITMLNSRVRQAGGCIYLISSNKKQKINIQQSLFYRCQALENSFMYVEFNPDAFLQEVEFNTVQIANNSMDNLLSVTPQIQTFEELYLLQTSSIYTQKNGRLTIINCDISDMQYQSIFQLSALRLLSINGLRITKSILFYTPTIQLSLLQSGAQVYMGNVEIIQIEESLEAANSSADCILLESWTYKYQSQDCDSINTFSEYLDELSQDDEIYAPSDELYDEIQLNQDQKYLPKDISQISTKTTSIIYEILDYQNSDLISCLMSSILYLAQQLNLDQFSSLFYLDEVTDNHKVELKKISFTKNSCLKCTGGLLQIRQITDSNTQQLIYIEEFYCRYNIIGYYGCASFINQDTITLVTLYSQIVNDEVDQNRLLQDVTQLNHTLLISSYECNDNSAKAGTCLNLNGVTTIVINSLFSSNKASLVGGAVYFVNTGNNNFYQTENQYINNFAQEGGGIYLINYQLSDTEKENVNFDKNTASGSAIDIQESTMSQTLQLIDTPFSSAIYLNFSGDYNDDGSIDNTSVIVRDNVSLSYSFIGNYPEKTNLLILPSGIKIQNYLYYYEETQEQIPFEWVFRVINLNRFGDPVKNGVPTDMCTIDGRIQNFNAYDDTLVFTNNFTVPSKVNYNSDKGGFDMDELVLTFDPKFDSKYYLELRFICNSVSLPIYNVNPPYQIIGQNTNYELLARVRTFPCQLGEAYDSEQCKACSKSQLVYSVVPDSTQCKQMNRLTMNDVSPIGIDLIHGFWRPNYQNDNVEKCVNLDNNCNGGWVPGDPSCYTGHLGALCESCDIYQLVNDEKWAVSGAYKCGKCSETEQYNVAIIVAISILTMISTITSVKGTYESLQLQIVEEAVALFKVRLKSDSSNLATMVQTLTNYFQIVQIVMTFQLQMPSGVETATTTAGNPTGSMAYSLDCLLIKISDTPVLYFKMIWALVMPLLYLGSIIFGYLIICLAQVTKFNSSIIYTAFIYMFLYLHPTVVQGFISQASVRTVSGLPWVKADVAYRYDSNLHAYWLARFIGPMLGIWVIGLPCLFMFLVWRKRNSLNTKTTRMKLGYFYRQYQPNSYLWEFVKIFQKEFFVIILVYYEEFVIIKGLLIVLVLFIYGWYQVSVSPFGSQKLNTTDRYSTMICAATLCLGVLMYGAQLKNYYYMQVIILIILAFINLWFIIKCLLQIFDGYLIKFQDQLDIIREKVIASKPELKTRTGMVGKLLVHRGNMNKRVKCLWDLFKTKTMMAVKITKLANNVSFEDAFEYIVTNNVQETQIPKVSFRNQQEFQNIPDSA